MSVAAPVQSPLTLVLPIKSPEAAQQLREILLQIHSLPPEQNPISAALNATRVVHFARFALVDETKLAVFTTYDGDLEPYVMDFATALGSVLDDLLEFVEGAPPRPLLEHRDEFYAFVSAHNLPVLQWYSAYPELTVLDINSLAEERVG